MKYELEVHKVPEPVVIIRNWFTEPELNSIWQELDVVCSPFISRDETITRSAMEDGVLLKKGYGVRMDSFYGQSRDLSNILTIGRKLFDVELIEQLIEIDHSFKHYLYSDIDFTLVNYYENKSEYRFHTDTSMFTANVVLWREPKMFDGGKFVVTDDALDFDISSNDLVIFPGYLRHSVTTISMHDGFIPWKSGRYSIANFIKYRSTK